MTGYTKLFNSIVTSTIWTEDDKTRIVWITMLAIADKNGEVQGSIPGLARIAGVDVESCRIAIGKFLSPDPDSRTKDDEGRRIEEIDGGWSLLNHQKYREMASRDEQREAEAKRKARYRNKIKRNQKPETGGNVPDVSQNVPDMSPDVPKTLHIAEADTEADTEAEAKAEPEAKRARPPRTPEPTGPDYANPEFFANLQGKVRGLSREWSKPFMRSEMEELSANAEFFASVSEPEWIDLRFFMSAKTIPPELDAKAYWRPNSRLMFIRNAADMATKAANFRRECRKAGYEVPEHPKDQP
jgi:hypothetical protein